jgi:cytochrome c peroxidase
MQPANRALGLMLAALMIAASACNGSGSGSSPHAAAAAPDTDTDPPEVQVGERLFLETRFSQFFFANSGGDVNAVLKAGDPVVNNVQTTGEPLPGPFRGQSMNCRQCHLVDDLKPLSPFYVRSYSDFATRSPIPARSGQLLTTTPRNSPTLVNATLPRDVPQIYHLDGEFATVKDLVEGTFTGSNFGWLPGEYDTAVAHIANVIRNDNGQNDLAKGYGGGGVSYSTLLLGTDPSIPQQLVIPTQYRIDVTIATDEQVLGAVAALIHAYLDSLRFSSDSSNQYNGSPYDVFLEKNNLPRSPDPGETNLAYSQRLLGLIDAIPSPIFVTPADAPPSASNGKPEFQLQENQKFSFGQTELAGLKTFFAQDTTPGASHFGNCIACHTAPNFTDFRFHNVGASQVEYDGVFGSGAFNAIFIPALSDRNADFDEYLPPSANHPDATSRFRSPAELASPGYTDLGVWNIVGNPDVPNPQTTLLEILCSEFNLSGADCEDDAVLPLTIGFFKTPTVRDLGQSAPYLHNGSINTIEDVINFYVNSSQLARGGTLRNGSPEMSAMSIDQTDVDPLAAFLRALNEDYD